MLGVDKLCDHWAHTHEPSGAPPLEEFLEKSVLWDDQQSFGINFRDICTFSASVLPRYFLRNSAHWEQDVLEYIHDPDVIGCIDDLRYVDPGEFDTSNPGLSEDDAIPADEAEDGPAILSVDDLTPAIATADVDAQPAIAPPLPDFITPGVFTRQDFDALMAWANGIAQAPGGLDVGDPEEDLYQFIFGLDSALPVTKRKNVYCYGAHNNH